MVDTYFPNDSEIQLAKIYTSNGGLEYQHFFITDKYGALFLELSSKRSRTPNSEDFYYTNRVQCNTLPYLKYSICEKTYVTPAIKERMTQMLGMCNYSLCLRNSEHIANYIFKGVWASFQMEEGGALLSYFRSKMTTDQLNKINIFPSTIQPKTIGGSSFSKMYSMIDKQYTPTSFQYFSSGNKDSYNILVVGKSSQKPRSVSRNNIKICKNKILF